MAELNTYGDLKNVINSIILKQKGLKIGSVALDTVAGLIPGVGAAKTTYDFIKAAISKPDIKKTNTWLDKLDIDDEMSAIVDDTVENGFMQFISKSIESEPNDKPLEQDFNMNVKMVNYLKQKYQGRTVAGIKENKEMNIKEYIKKIVREIVSEDGLEEMSVSANAGGYTPIMMVSKNKEGSPAALQAAEDEGFTKVKPGIPSDSKVFDYKQITGKKPKSYKMYETIDKIVKEELLNEGTYSKFKNEVKLRSKNEALHKAIKEVKRKLMEIDRIVEYTSMMKQELSEGEEGLKYWKTTEANVSRISEMVNNLNTKIQNLQQ